MGNKISAEHLLTLQNAQLKAQLAETQFKLALAGLFVTYQVPENGTIDAGTGEIKFLKGDEQ